MTARDLFDIPRDIAYLNCAYMGPLPRASARAGANSYTAKTQPWRYDVQGDFFDAPEALRAEAAKLFGADAASVALVPAASYGLAVAARNLKPAAGSEIVVLAEQFPSNVYVWRELAARTGAIVRTVSRRPGESWTEALLPAIGPATSILALPQVHWADGGLVDLVAAGAAARRHGAALVLDLTQSLGAAYFKAEAVQPDFAVAAAYKWLLGPYTIGFLSVAPWRQSGEPLEENWIAREGAEDFARLVDYSEAHAPGARRFDMGERSGFQLVPAALASLQQINAWNVLDIETALAERTAQLAEAAAPFGLADDTPDRAPHYLCLTLPEGAPADLAARLAARGVYVSKRGDRLRVTPHLYTDETDIARFADALRETLA